VLYTCYQPAAQATEADLAAKRHAYENYAITTHWPAANVTVGAPPSDEEREKYTLPRTRSRVGSGFNLSLPHWCHLVMPRVSSMSRSLGCDRHLELKQQHAQTCSIRKLPHTLSRGT
jgi:hypothetical protein